MTPSQFELHAGSGNKRPPEYIYLDNGNTPSTRIYLLGDFRIRMLICRQRLKKVLDRMGWESCQYQTYEMNLLLVFINDASLVNCLTFLLIEKMECYILLKFL